SRRESSIREFPSFEVNRESGESKEYRLAVESGPEFDGVPLTECYLGCEVHKLHIYDRQQSSMGSNTILEDHLGQTMLNLYRIPRKRIFARLRDDHSLVVYNPNTKKWSPYFLSPASHLNLDSLNIRGLHETFGRAGHRMGAIESPLSVYTDGPVVVARIKRNQKHFFYRVTFGKLAVESGPEFDGVPLENAILGCGVHNLHIYDRSIVMGSIPYWDITLG
ncbi:hypothetical protein OSTOST_13316, partial [Ostertagia ostertagi]